MTDPFAGNRCAAHNLPLSGPQSCLICDPDKATPMETPMNDECIQLRADIAHQVAATQHIETSAGAEWRRLTDRVAELERENAETKRHWVEDDRDLNELIAENEQLRTDLAALRAVLKAAQNRGVIYTERMGGKITKQCYDLDAAEVDALLAPPPAVKEKP